MDEKINDLYIKYKYYYGNNENVNTLGLMKSVYDQTTNTIINKIQYFNHCKFEGFYLIEFVSQFLDELKETMIFFGKKRQTLIEHLFILYYHLFIGRSRYKYHNVNKIIDEYCSMYDDFQKIKFIQRLPELTIYKDMFCVKPTVIKLSETEYKLCEKFLLKQLKFKNVIKIEHYPKRGFLRRI